MSWQLDAKSAIRPIMQGKERSFTMRFRKEKAGDSSIGKPKVVAMSDVIASPRRWFGSRLLLI